MNNMSTKDRIKEALINPIAILYHVYGFTFPNETYEERGYMSVAGWWISCHELFDMWLSLEEWGDWLEQLLEAYDIEIKEEDFRWVQSTYDPEFYHMDLNSIRTFLDIYEIVEDDIMKKHTEICRDMKKRTKEVEDLEDTYWDIWQNKEFGPKQNPILCHILGGQEAQLLTVHVSLYLKELIDHFFAVYYCPEEVDESIGETEDPVLVDNVYVYDGHYLSLEERDALFDMNGIPTVTQLEKEYEGEFRESVEEDEDEDLDQEVDTEDEDETDSSYLGSIIVEEEDSDEDEEEDEEEIEEDYRDGITDSIVNSDSSSEGIEVDLESLWQVPDVKQRSTNTIDINSISVDMLKNMKTVTKETPISDKPVVKKPVVVPKETVDEEGYRIIHREHGKDMIVIPESKLKGVRKEMSKKKKKRKILDLSTPDWVDESEWKSSEEPKEKKISYYKDDIIVDTSRQDRIDETLRELEEEEELRKNVNKFDKSFGCDLKHPKPTSLESHQFYTELQEHRYQIAKLYCAINNVNEKNYVTYNTIYGTMVNELKVDEKVKKKSDWFDGMRYQPKETKFRLQFVSRVMIEMCQNFERVVMSYAEYKKMPEHDPYSRMREFMEKLIKKLTNFVMKVISHDDYYRELMFLMKSECISMMVFDYGNQETSKEETRKPSKNKQNKKSVKKATKKPKKEKSSRVNPPTKQEVKEKRNTLTDYIPAYCDAAQDYFRKDRGFFYRLFFPVRKKLPDNEMMYLLCKLTYLTCTNNTLEDMNLPKIPENFSFRNKQQVTEIVSVLGKRIRKSKKQFGLTMFFHSYFESKPKLQTVLKGVNPSNKDLLYGVVGIHFFNFVANSPSVDKIVRLCVG